MSLRNSVSSTIWRKANRRLEYFKYVADRFVKGKIIHTSWSSKASLLRNTSGKYDFSILIFFSCTVSAELD